MIEIKLDNNEIIHLDRMNLLLLPAGCQLNSFSNEEYDIIMVIAGIDRSISIELKRKTILIVEAGIRTNINVTGEFTQYSQVVFIAGLENVVTGIPNQNLGNIYNMRNEKFDLSAISKFKQITIK